MKPLFIRGTLYFLLTIAVAQFLHWEVTQLSNRDAFSEWGYTEWLQSLILLLTAGFLILKARLDDGYRQLAVCMALAFLILLIRENDQTFERWLFDGFWKIPATITMLAGVWYGWKSRIALREQLERYSTTLAFGITLGGFAALLFSRLVGRSSYWEAMLGEGFQRVIKNAAEEGTELFALSLLMAGAVEFWKKGSEPF